MTASSSWLRIAVVQFAPKLGEVNANIAKARELCWGLAPRSVDLVCFPEMIFTGYMFPDAPSIAPYLEHPRTGPTTTFCAELAKRLQCYVAAGFPERLEPFTGQSESESVSGTVSTIPTPSASPLLGSIGANAALLHDPTGHLLHTYHKSNLFPTDFTWARSGPGFTTLDLPMPFGRIALAICNDVNVNVNVNVGGPDGGGVCSVETLPYELAGFCRREGVRVLLLLNAWLREEREESGDHDRDRVGSTGTDGNGHDGDESEEVENDLDGDDDGSEPNWRVLNYWAMRLRPLWAKDDVDPTMQTEDLGALKTTRTDDEREVLVVICNRFGRERGKTFAGSSAMFSMRPGSGKPRLLHVMGEREEGVSVWTARIGFHSPA